MTHVSVTDVVKEGDKKMATNRSAKICFTMHLLVEKQVDVNSLFRKHDKKSDLRYLKETSKESSLTL